MLADAESAGKSALEAASARAETELKELRRKAEEQTAEKTAALENEMIREADALRKAAEGKLEEAAAAVVERIVGG
jgi:F0F1-type ATP synthase membrane subunit b/b'